MDIPIQKISDWASSAVSTVRNAIAPVLPGAAAPRPAPFGPAIAVVNHSTLVANAQAQAACAAIQIQIDRDFAPAWGAPAVVTFYPVAASVPPTAWLIQVLDTSDQPGALGYHTMTATDLPEAKIFAADDQKYGLSWSVTLSHEILEMIADPFTDTCVFAQDSNTTGTLYAFEVADPCEDDGMGYRINGVLVSDFILPAYFESGRAPFSTKFDFCGHLSSPLSIGRNGYSSVFAVNPGTAGWSQQTGGEMGPRLAAKIDRANGRIGKRRVIRQGPAEA